MSGKKKMAGSKTKDTDTDKAKPANPSRRSFLTRMWLALGAVAAGEYAWLIVKFLRPRKPREAVGIGADIFVAGPVERFEPNSVTAFPKGKFYLARTSNGGFLAMSRECTHLGCTVPWIAEEGKFVCPCHASAYDLTGAVLNPPAPRALDLYAVRIENRIVKVDLSRKIRRETFADEQVTIS
jgi:cytochrome b6-f complex iron-sulfur subunit